ncbi:MAG: ABC transporter permease [Bacteroidales bacterium]|jgi:ABC-2 type transport system permease protein|nr:ABC transporter permease [Bacteroidales bacterium]
MIKFLIEKEFKQILQNKFLLALIFVFPTFMLLLLPWAANQEIKNMKLSIVDNDHSTYSERLTQKVTASGYFQLTDFSPSYNRALESIDAGKADIILEIQPEFERDLFKTGTARVMISANAVNGMKGGLGSMYLVSIIRDFSQELLAEQGLTSKKTIMPFINNVPYYLFNPHLNYNVFMVPALMVLLLTLLAGFLPALNIVSEKEVGTIEQLNVTPVRKTTFIFAKLIPFWIIGFIVLTVCMMLSVFIYNLTPVGSLATIYLYAGIYVLIVSGLGLVVSNYSATMQQAMFVIFFFMMILILMSGLFTPVSSMPGWAQVITIFNPMRYYMEVMRAVYLKGSAMTDLLPQLITLCGFAVFFNGWAVISYRKRS